MKRFIAVFCIFCGAALLSAENTGISFSAGASYTDYFSRTTLDAGAASASPLWAQMKTGTVYERNRAAGFSFDARLYYFYAMLCAAFPQKSWGTVLNAAPPGDMPLSSGAYMLDVQTGAGYTFFKEKPVTLFVGGGFGLNSKRSFVHVSGKEYLRADTLIGAGLNILLSFYPLSQCGFYIGAADSVYFYPLKMQRVLDGVELNNAAVKKPLANSLNIKGGIVIRL